MSHWLARLLNFQPGASEPVWEPSLLESQIAELLTEAPVGCGVFVVPFRDLKSEYPWMAIVRTHETITQ